MSKEGAYVNQGVGPRGMRENIWCKGLAQRAGAIGRMGDPVGVGRHAKQCIGGQH